jgi:hypothetical protein
MSCVKSFFFFVGLWRFSGAVFVARFMDMAT